MDSGRAKENRVPFWAHRKLNEKAHVCAEISKDPLPSVRTHGVIGYEMILAQTENAIQCLEKYHPSHFLTIGGGCDADLASIAYLNERYGGDLTVIWFDAHGDMNAPEESETGLFYGMPARMLMEPCYDFRRIITRLVFKRAERGFSAIQ